MEIILKEDVIGVGYKDDIVTVKAGYGRNYLIPKGMAIIATVSARKQLAENLRQQAVKLAKMKAAAEELAGRLNGVSLVIPVKVSPSGVIYGSVGPLQIAEGLRQLGFNVDRKVISVKDIKEVGNYTALVRLHKEVSAEVTFDVVDANGSVSAEKGVAGADATAEAAGETQKEDPTGASAGEVSVSE